MKKIALIAVALLFATVAASAQLEELIQQNVQDARHFHEKPARIWVHVRSDAQKGIGEKLLGVVDGFNSEQIRVEAKPLQLVDYGPEESQLRFFKQKDKAEAATLLELLRRYIPQLELIDLSREYANVDWLRPGHYELWLSPGLTDLASPE